MRIKAFFVWNLTKFNYFRLKLGKKIYDSIMPNFTKLNESVQFQLGLFKKYAPVVSVFHFVGMASKNKLSSKKQSLFSKFIIWWKTHIPSFYVWTNYSLFYIIRAVWLRWNLDQSNQKFLIVPKLLVFHQSIPVYAPKIYFFNAQKIQFSKMLVNLKSFKSRF